jgi:hypothetical protein
MVRRLIALLFATFLTTSTWAQEVPNHAVPIGRGPGVVGWGSLGPCAAGQTFGWTAPNTDPACILSGGGGATASITRAQIPSTHTTSAATLILNGYRAVNDPGYGAPYTCSGQTSASWDAIQDTDGVWCALNITAIQYCDPGWFGGQGSGSTNQISAGDITANPQWRGTYTAGTEWDTVGIQEAIYCAFATNSTPGSLAWNVNTSVTNKRFFNSLGTAYFWLVNKTINVTANFGVMEWAGGKGNINSGGWVWMGPQSSSMLFCNSCAYMAFYYPTFNSGTGYWTNDGTQQPLWLFDHASSPGGLNTQQNTIYDAFIGVTANGRGVAYNLTTSSQGDTQTWINPFFAGSPGARAYELNSQNTLQHVFINGDFQGFLGCAIVVNGGSVYTFGTHFENQNSLGPTGFAPSLNQINTNGGDVCITSGNSDNTSHMVSNRSEGNIPLRDDGFNAQATDVLTTASDGRSGFFTNFPFLPGNVVWGGVGTKGRTFMMVDGGAVAAGVPMTWRSMNTGTNLTTFTDPGSPGYTVNALVGYTFHFRFASNGNTQHCDITSNTANTITIGTNCSGQTNFTVNANSRYYITGKTNPTTPPSWDSAAKGVRTQIGGNNGVGTTAGSNIVCVGNWNGTAPNVNDYIAIPGADQLNDGLHLTNFALMAKITAKAAASGNCATLLYPSQYTINRNATVTVASMAFAGTPITDAVSGTPGQGGLEQWIDVEYLALGLGIQSMNNVQIDNGLIGSATANTSIRTSRPDWLDPGFFIGNLNAPFLYSAAGTPLPTCAAGNKGAIASVSDATAPTYNATYTSGGAVTVPVVCNGTNWVTH